MTLKAKHYNRILVIIGLLLVFTTPVFADDYETTIPAFNYGSYTVPAYDGDPSEAVNGNLPAFSSEELNAIVPAKAKIANARNSLAGAIRIEAKKQEGVSGYQYAWRMKGKTWAKVSYNRNVRIVKNLKAGKTYQVKVRTYKKINGKNWYGKWSTVKSVKVKK